VRVVPGAQRLGRTKLVVEHQHVVHQAALLHGAQPALHSGVCHPSCGVGLVLQDVAQAFEGRVRAPRFQPRSQLRIAQIGPAHHAPHAGVLLRHLQQKVGLVPVAAGLHRHHRVDPGSLQRARAVGRQAVALQRWHGVADPGKVSALVAPVVLVGVDLHRGRKV